MSQLELDVASHDLVRRNGTFQRIEGGPEIRQSLRVRLVLFRGEAFLNTDLGVPYFSEVLRKGIDEAALVTIFREAILDTDGVVSVEALDLTYVPTERRLDVVFVCTGSLDELAEDLKIEETVEVPI